jgi:hypothetical protein
MEENKTIEYVECIKGDGERGHNIVGNIYKVRSYCPIDGYLRLDIHEGGINNIFFGEDTKITDNYTDYKPSTKEAFDKQNFKTIAHNQAQQIIDIACSAWKDKLFSWWGKKIVLKQEIQISENDYQTMRKACTDEQNKLFDEIFGKDDNFIPEGTPCLARDYDFEIWKLVYSNGDGTFKGGDIHDRCRWSHVQVLDINNLPKY